MKSLSIAAQVCSESAHKASMDNMSPDPSSALLYVGDRIMETSKYSSRSER